MLIIVYDAMYLNGFVTCEGYQSFLFGKPAGVNERLLRYRRQDFAKTLK